MELEEVDNVEVDLEEVDNVERNMEEEEVDNLEVDKLERKLEEVDLELMVRHGLLSNQQSLEVDNSFYKIPQYLICLNVFRVSNVLHAYGAQVNAFHI